MNIYDYSLLVGIHKKKETFGFPQKSVSLDHKLTFDSSKEQQDSGTPRRHTMERLLNQTSLPSITPEKFYNNYLESNGQYSFESTDGRTIYTLGIIDS